MLFRCLFFSVFLWKNAEMAIYHIVIWKKDAISVDFLWKKRRKGDFSYYNIEKCRFGAFFLIFYGKNAKTTIFHIIRRRFGAFPLYLWKKCPFPILLWKKRRNGDFSYYNMKNAVFDTFFIFFLRKTPIRRF